MRVAASSLTNTRGMAPSTTSLKRAVWNCRALDQQKHVKTKANPQEFKYTSLSDMELPDTLKLFD